MVDANKLWSLVHESFPVWNFGILHRPFSAKNFSFGEHQIKWFAPKKPLAVAADPFLFTHNDATYIFFEAVAKNSLIGKIAYCIYDGKKFSEPVLLTLGSALRHYSYPFLFQWKGQIYMTVENYSTGCFVLFRCNEFPNRWERIDGLFDKPVVDPTVFVHENKLWLFYTLEGEGHAHDQLYLRYATQPEGPWLEHPANPIKEDIAAARPAGALFWEDGKIYRPAQDCSLVYGHHIVLHEVTKLSPTEFEERKLHRVGPLHQEPYTQGLHTINSNEQFTVVDARRIRQQPRRLDRIASIVAKRAFNSMVKGNTALGLLYPMLEFVC